MNKRYVAWALLIAACGLQAYLVATGTEYFVDFELVVLPQMLHYYSSYLFAHYLLVPFRVSGIIAILTAVLPLLATILSWVFLGLRRRSGWNLALAVDLYFALPSLALVCLDILQNLRYRHLGMHNNPEVLLLVLSSLHILLLLSPPICALILPRQVPQDFEKHSSLRPLQPSR